MIRLVDPGQRGELGRQRGALSRDRALLSQRFGGELDRLVEQQVGAGKARILDKR